MPDRAQKHKIERIAMESKYGGKSKLIYTYKIVIVRIMSYWLSLYLELSATQKAGEGKWCW